MLKQVSKTLKSEAVSKTSWFWIASRRKPGPLGTMNSTVYKMVCGLKSKWKPSLFLSVLIDVDGRNPQIYVHNSDLQPFSSHDIYKLITEILQHTKKKHTFFFFWLIWPKK